MISRWLIRWMINDWVKTRILFRFLKAWIIDLNFSNVLSLPECLISFTKRKLKVRTSEEISALLTDKKIIFSSRSTIFCCLDAMKKKSTLVVELRVKLRYAIEIEYFLDRSRPCLIDSMRTIIVRSFWDSMNKDIFDDDDEFLSSTWLSWWYDLTEIDRNFVNSLDNSMIVDSLCILNNLNNSFHDSD
jgi:hypothetical protein